MPLGTLDSAPPPFFRQGPSALSKLVFFSALAVFLMVADTRLQVAAPLRSAAATLLYPLQWLVLKPVGWARSGSDYLVALGTAQAREEATQKQLNAQSLRATQVEQLTQENQRLRQLLELRARLSAPAQAAQVLYDAADPYTRKVIIDRGLLGQVQPGSPVLDQRGLLGQVTRVYPLVSEVTLVSDREQATPVLNTRTGVRGIAFGDSTLRAGALELRFMAANADVQVGDLLTTSGIDGTYPPGLAVARVETVERRADSGFARILCTPLAGVDGTQHVLVLAPLVKELPARPSPEPAAATPRKGASR
jgi:rod shape-determining protein MreC